MATTKKTEPRTRIYTPAGLYNLVTHGKWRYYSHLRPINKALMLSAGGHQRRLQVGMPPRHGKSFLCGRAFPFYYLNVFPDRNVFYVSHSEDIARETGEAVRDLYRTFGPQVSGYTIRPTRAGALDWAIVDRHGQPTGGGMRCAGIRSGVHGYGCDILILDDLFGTIAQAASPAYREHVWRQYNGSLQTRLTANASVIAIGTPFHSDDFFGRLQKAEDRDGDKWARIKLPALAKENDPLGRPIGEALWPEYFPKTRLEEIKANFQASGELRDWQAQYCLEPLAGDGVSAWPDDYFNAHIWFDDYPPEEEIRWRVLAIDTSKGESATGDFQALVLVGLTANGQFYVEAELCRLDDARLLDKAVELIKLWNPQTTVVETNNAGYTLFNALGRQIINGTYVSVLGRNHGGGENKNMRIDMRLTSQLARGSIKFRRTPGTRMVVEQLRDWPNGTYDDGPDALELGMELCGQLVLPMGHPQRAVKYAQPRRVAC